MIIEIIGSVGGKPFFTPEEVASLLEANHTELNYGSQFMGRPSTLLYSGATAIVKLRSELKLNNKSIREWTTHTLEREQKLGVHHPHKCWFIAELKPGEYCAGNICPKLTPLHTLFSSTDACDNRQKLVLLKNLYQIYFKVAALFDKRLDEGLSNFGVDGQNQLYYLDDDIYTWDNFLTFSHILGVLIRNNAWFDEECTEDLANSLYQLVGDYFKNSEAYAMIAGKLRDIFMPNAHKQKIFEIIIRKFQENKVISKKMQFNQRYWAIIADVHANLPALDAVLNFLRQENINQGIVIGDTIGYGPHPVECIERLQNSSFQVIKGNHDHAAVSGNIRRGMSATASWCIEWTIPKLNAAHKQWLEDLPLELTGMTETAHHWLAVHGSPLDPHYFYGYVYEMTYEDNLSALAQRKIHLCFHGHAHVQGIYARKKGASDSFYKEKQQNLEKYSYSLICPGSVGQPRDGNVGAQFAIYDQKLQVLTLHSLPYPLDETISAMKQNNFPESIASRLEKGY